MEFAATAAMERSFVATQWMRWKRVLLGRSSAVPLMRHVETLHLGRKRSLLLVECGGGHYLITASGDSLSAPVGVLQNPLMTDESGWQQRGEQ
jgi:hypothetical protein